MKENENPYIVMNTKEDFEKWFKEIHDDGYESGYKDGLVRALGYIYNAIDEHFDDEIRNIPLAHALSSYG